MWASARVILNTWTCFIRHLWPLLNYKRAMRCEITYIFFSSSLLFVSIFLFDFCFFQCVVCYWLCLSFHLTRQRYLQCWTNLNFVVCWKAFLFSSSSSFLIFLQSCWTTVFWALLPVWLFFFCSLIITPNTWIFYVRIISHLRATRKKK